MTNLSFLIVTTNNLPEAYYIARFLTRKKQRVAIINITGRTFLQKVKALAKINRNRGVLYVCDLALGKLLRGWYQSPGIVPFPDIGPKTIESIRGQCRYFESGDAHDERTLDFAKKADPDYLLIAGAPVLRQSLVRIARQGALNRHLGLSPRYRGSDCPMWALYENDLENMGFTIHFVNEKVDGGAVVMQKKAPLDRTKDFSRTIADIQLKASQGYIAVLQDIISGRALPRTVQEKGGNHYPPAGLTIIRGAYKNYQRFLGNAVKAETKHAQ
jgi:folate-dependent phosphoribosylglycinamide formyltransferase PurN